MLKSLFLILACSLFIFFLPAASAQNIACSIDTSCSNTTILYMKNDTGGYWNAHAQNISAATYPYMLCCDSPYNLSPSCAQTTLLRLSNYTDAHVQTGSYLGSTYPHDVCIYSDSGNLSCTYPNNACPPGYECMLSMASSNVSADNLTDSHIGPCQEYMRKVCCKIDSSPEEPPPEEPPPGPGGGGASVYFFLRDVSAEEVMIGGETNVNIRLEGTLNYNETDINISILDCPDGWFCESLEIPVLVRRESLTVSLKVAVPEDAASGSYTLTLLAAGRHTREQKGFDLHVSPVCVRDSQCRSDERCMNNICVRLFDIKILRSDSPMKPGELLDFTYLLKDMSNVSDDVQITYMLTDSDGTMVAEGSEVVYVAGFEEKREESYIHVPTSALGTYILTVQLSYNDYSVSSNKTIEVVLQPELVIDLDISDIKVLGDGSVMISIYLASNLDEEASVTLQCRVSRDSLDEWYLKRETSFNRTLRMDEIISGLGDGTHTAAFTATYGSKTSSVVKTFVTGASWESPSYLDPLIIQVISVLALMVIICILLIIHIVNHRKIASLKKEINTMESELNNDKTEPMSRKDDKER